MCILAGAQKTGSVLSLIKVDPYLLHSGNGGTVQGHSGLNMMVTAISYNRNISVWLWGAEEYFLNKTHKSINRQKYTDLTISN